MSRVRTSSIVWAPAFATGFGEAGPHLFTIHAHVRSGRLTLGLLAWTLRSRCRAVRAAAPARADAIRPRLGTRGVACGRLDRRRDGHADPSRRLSQSPPQIITSDRQGAFTFEGLPAGRYRLSASKSGYTNRQPLQASAERFDTGRELTLRDPSTRRISRSPSIAESSIAGRVAEPDGIPAPDVQVFAAVRRVTGHFVLQETRTVAEWDGRYRLTGLPPGEYLVVILPGVSTDPNRMRANAERRAPESSSATRPFFEPTFYPGATSLASAETSRCSKECPSMASTRG